MSAFITRRLVRPNGTPLLQQNFTGPESTKLKLEPAADENLQVLRLSFGMPFLAGWTGAKFAQLASALSVGLNFFVNQNSQIVHLTGGVPIKTNADLLLACDEYQTIGNVLICTMNLRGNMLLRGDTADCFALEVQDDLSSSLLEVSMTYRRTR